MGLDKKESGDFVKDTRRNISAHFTIDEVAHSERAIKEGWDNTLPDIYFGNAQNLARYVLEPIRLAYGKPFSPSSWYRCERLNNTIGGAHGSQHCIGQAADITVPNVSVMALCEYIKANLDFDQLILEPSWVHVSYCKDNNRKQVLHKTETGYAEGLE